MSRSSSEFEVRTVTPSKSAYIKGVKATLESYLESNKVRRIPNKSREKLFSKLITQLAAIENQQDTLSVIEILITIKSELLLASEVNNGFDKGDEHQGLSTDALDGAIGAINTALAFEKRREHDLIIESIHQAEHIAAERAIAQMHEEADANVHAMLQAQDATTVIASAISQKRIHTLDPRDVIARIERSKQDIRATVLTDMQRAFYRDLKNELAFRKLPVGPGILNLLVQSPLADRYATLVAENVHPASKISGLPLRNMIRTMGEIIRLCILNNNASLKDLHHLFMARDENALLEVLNLLHGKGALTLDTKKLTVQLSDDTTPITRQVMSVSEAFDKTLSATKQLDMANVASALEEARELAGSLHPSHATAAASAPPMDAAKIQEDMMSATNHLFHCVKLSITISHLIEEISVNSQELVTQTQEVGAKERHTQLQGIAKELRPQFVLLIELMNAMKLNSEELKHVITQLDLIYQQAKSTQFRNMDIALMQQFTLLNEDYQKWNTDYRNTQDDLDLVLKALNGGLELEPTHGLQVVDRLEALSQKAQEEATLKAKIRDDIVKVKTALTKQSATDHSMSLLQISARVSASPDSRMQALTLEFLTKLANKFSNTKDDCESAIDLALLLQKEGLLTRQMQHKLLHQQNIDVLLSLQKFLNESRIAVTPSVLNKLWDNLHGNPDFNALKLLQTRLKLDADTTLQTIENLSRSWKRSLPMLTEMFSDTDKTAAFIQLIGAAKTDHLLITKIYQIYDAMREHQPSMLNNFFNASAMQKLIDAIGHSEARFAGELVLRIEAVETVPFKAEEDWDYLLERTLQYDQRNLSYVNMLAEWENDHTDGTYFDDFSRVILGRFYENAQYTGAHQSNTIVISSELPSGQPRIDNTNAAQWHLACAKTASKPVKYDELEARMDHTLSSQVNLSPEHQFLLQLMQMAFKTGGSLYVDNDARPSFVGWLPADAVSASQAQFMDYYVYFSIQELHQTIVHLNELICAAQTLQDEIKQTGVKDIQAKSEQLERLTHEIAEAKSHLTHVAAESVRDAFDVPSPVVDRSLCGSSSVCMFPLPRVEPIDRKETQAIHNMAAAQ